MVYLAPTWALALVGTERVAVVLFPPRARISVGAHGPATLDADAIHPCRSLLFVSCGVNVGLCRAHRDGQYMYFSRPVV